MAITITLNDDLIAGLQDRANRERITMEQLAITILADAVAASDSATPEQVVAAIRAGGTASPQVRPATSNLASALAASAEDPSFDLANWSSQWSQVEAESKALTRSNGAAEGRSG